MYRTNRVLVLDHEMYHPEAHQAILTRFTTNGFAVDYRRYFPHITSSDLDYQVILVHGGRMPGVPGARMSYHEVEHYASYTRSGGMLVLAFAGGRRSNRGEHERYLFNVILQEMEAAIRINSDWVVDEVNGYPSTLVPSSYLKPLPMIRPFSGTYAGGDSDELFGSYESSLQVGRDAAVLLTSYDTAGIAEEITEFKPVTIRQSRCRYFLAAAASVGAGHVLVISRYLLNMGGFTGRTSDKPLLSREKLAFNERYVSFIVDRIVGVITDGAEWFPPTDHEPSSLSDVEDPDFPVNREAVPEPPRDAFDSLPLSNGAGEFAAWARLRKLRIGYSSIPTTEAGIGHLMDVFRETGLNTYFAFNHTQFIYSPSRSDAERAKLRAEWSDAARACHSHGLRCFLGSLYPHWQIFHEGDYAHLMDAAGETYDAPSAMDIEFWHDSVFRVADEMARLSLQEPGITGLFWDLEMYTFPGLNHQEGQAMEDACFETFLTAESPNLSQEQVARARQQTAAQRYQWLRDNGLLRRYYSVLERAVERLADELRNRIRTVNPALELALYDLHIPNNWFYRGFMKGLSSRDRPIVLLTYEAGGKEQQRTAALEGCFYLHCTGALLNALPPDRWQESLSKLCETTDGYWLFPLYPLQADREPSTLTGDETYLGTREQMIGGIARANRLIDARLNSARGN